MSEFEEQAHESAPQPQPQPCRFITPEVKRIEVVAGILWRGEHFLAACRPEGSVHAGLWEFPGGKVERGESALAALARELREELSVDVAVGSGEALRWDKDAERGSGEDVEYWRTQEHVYTTPPRHVTLHFFHVWRFSGEPCSCDGQELRWVTAAEACVLPFLEADVPLVRELKACTFPRA